MSEVKSNCQPPDESPFACEYRRPDNYAGMRQWSFSKTRAAAAWTMSPSGRRCTDLRRLTESAPCPEAIRDGRQANRDGSSANPGIRLSPNAKTVAQETQTK